MVTIGADLHKQTHTIVAADANGARLATKTIPATTAGHLAALQWAQQWPERRWALEDCRHLSRRFEQGLLVAGELVIRVPTKLMAGERRGARTRGKSDPIDALAAARAALREPDLPHAQLDGPSRELRVLTDHREDPVVERTRIQSRLRWHLHELLPGEDPPSRGLDRTRVLDAVEVKLVARSGVVAAVARELVQRCRELTVRITELERDIATRVRPMAPNLLALQGCGPLTAAKIVGEVAGMRRFRTRAAFAMHNGSAPIPVWSSNSERHRLSRGGNRQLNVALFRIAFTQMHWPGQGNDYVAKRLAAGNTRKEAMRALKRRISDEVYRRLCEDESALEVRSTPIANAA